MVCVKLPDLQLFLSSDHQLLLVAQHLLSDCCCCCLTDIVIQLSFLSKRLQMRLWLTVGQQVKILMLVLRMSLLKRKGMAVVEL